MFLHKLLPSDGLYCVAMALPSGGFRHFFREDLTQAQALIEQLDDAGHTVYIAQATFDPAKIAEAQAHNKALPHGAPRTDRMKERSQGNALALKNFFLDIDCGEKWPLKDQREGKLALIEFIKATGLPFPAVVNSGNGLYAHWILSEAIPATRWQGVAKLLKRVVAAYSPAIGGDASRTSDSASVLRPPGTTNRKPGKSEKLVHIIKDIEPISFMQFVGPLGEAARRKQVDRTVVLPPQPSSDVNADFSAGLEAQSVPSDPELVADACSQLGMMRSSGGDISEPLWYACIGVLVHCADGDITAHRWSIGHPNYSETETTAKLSQWRSTGVGPSTCASFGTTNPSGCVGCKHNGKVKSPILLGRPAPKEKEIPVEQCDAPEGFKRSDTGLYYEEEGRWIRFYDQDLYPDRLAFDQSLGYEVMTIKHHLPHEGELECTIRSSIVNDPKALLTLLSDNHIKVVGMKEKKFMTAYLESYQAKLQRQRQMSKLLLQMGWAESNTGAPMFVLGRKIFHADGHIEDASLARNVPKAAEAFHSKGDLQTWSAATKVFDQPGMEPFAFALLCSLGSPLMKETGFDGAMVSLVGESGSGKTMSLMTGLSVWGNHKDLMMLKDDTKNAMISRLGVYGNLPMAIDEVTNIDGMELSDLVYRATQGRDKARLTKNSEEKSGMNKWNTLVLASSNSSLVDKLSGAKHDATPEINRVFEYPVAEHPAFKDKVTEAMYWTITNNYGVAGEEYVKWLVTHTSELKRGIDKVKALIDKKAEVRGDERFWSAVAAVAIYGGLIAQKLGLIQFDVVRVMHWVTDTIFNMRGDKVDLAGDSVSILAQFIDAHSSNILIVKRDSSKPGRVFVVELHRGPLVGRYEVDTGRLYLSQAVFKHWLARRFGSYTKTKNDLLGCKALLNPNGRKVLTSGTEFSGAQQAVWELNMRCQKLNGSALQLVQSAEMMAQAPLDCGREAAV